MAPIRIGLEHSAEKRVSALRMSNHRIDRILDVPGTISIMYDLMIDSDSVILWDDRPKMPALGNQ
jgi:hypothetical protein